MTDVANGVAGHNGGVTDAPRRGRPRSAGADEAILTATLDVAREVGFRGMSMDVIAERAGVSKATIYRRWASKEALVLQALRSAINPMDEVDLGSVRADLVTYLNDLADRMASGNMTDVLPHLIEWAVHDEQLRVELDGYVAHRRQPLVAILTRGIERGEIRDDLDLDTIVDAFVGPFIYRKLLTGDAIDATLVDRLLALILPTITP
ncbi:TetR family transcriptional regulator [Ilumatobacter fluminis]|uniref:TetR family transcriptional regulator n=1 Tax=Ilumatobacter fluminis TaxID=467091 RepID=A0A4R7HWK4_9ACTN|nr:TetR family transcriptional regulator [Ilumatobacter fluminis]